MKIWVLGSKTCAAASSGRAIWHTGHCPQHNVGLSPGLFHWFIYLFATQVDGQYLIGWLAKRHSQSPDPNLYTSFISWKQHRSQVYPCTHGLAWAKNPRVCILSQSTNGRNRCRDANPEASFQPFILTLTHWEFGCATEGICRMSSRFLFTLLCCCQATETSRVSQSPKGEVVLFSCRLCCVPASWLPIKHRRIPLLFQ